MTLLGLIRHGPTDWNAAGRLQGRTDIELGDHGRAGLEGRLLPSSFADARWLSSPLRRATQTARLLGAPRPIQTDDRLIEAAWGAWEGKKLEDLRQELGEEMRENEARGLHFRPPGGESPAEVQARLKPFLEEVAATPHAVVAITHKGVIRAVLALATGWDMTTPPPERLDWSCLHVFSLDGGTVKPHALNQALGKRSES